MAFSKLEAILKGVSAQTHDDLWQAAADALNRFSPSDCKGYFTAAGYGIT
jgi:hypothetical protein